jgi:hypothetical protein
MTRACTVGWLLMARSIVVGARSTLASKSAMGVRGFFGCGIKLSLSRHVRYDHSFGSRQGSKMAARRETAGCCQTLLQQFYRYCPHVPLQPDSIGDKVSSRLSERHCCCLTRVAPLASRLAELARSNHKVMNESGGHCISNGWVGMNCLSFPPCS